MISLTLDFITEEQESELISKFVFPPKFSAGRSGIVRYGSKKPYSNYHQGSIPDYLKLLPSSSVTVNKYDIGKGIAPHIDLGEGMISVISLGSESEIIFSLGEESKTLILPQRSLLQFDGDERYLWSHSVPPVKSLRYSIVYR